MDEENKIEKAIKELLYEQALREDLKKMGSRKNINFYLLSSVAAVLIILAGYFIINGMLENDLDRNTFITQNYEFPIVSKSRSSEINIVDSFIPELSQKKYDFVLSKFNLDSLSEKDLFVKAHIYFVLDSLDKSKEIIQSTKWLDKYNKSEINWLKFLIDYKLGSSRKELLDQINSLEEPYKRKAERMIK